PAAAPLNTGATHCSKPCHPPDSPPTRADPPRPRAPPPRLPAPPRAAATPSRSHPTRSGVHAPSPARQHARKTRAAHPHANAPGLPSDTTARQPQHRRHPAQTARPSTLLAGGNRAPTLRHRHTTLPVLQPAPAAATHPVHKPLHWLSVAQSPPAPLPHYTLRKLNRWPPQLAHTDSPTRPHAAP